MPKTPLALVWPTQEITETVANVANPPLYVHLSIVVSGAQHPPLENDVANVE